MPNPRPKKNKAKQPDHVAEARHYIWALLDDFEDANVLSDPENRGAVIKQLLESVDWGSVHASIVKIVLEPILKNWHSDILDTAKNEHLSICACCRRRALGRVAVTP